MQLKFTQETAVEVEQQISNNYVFSKCRVAIFRDAVLPIIVLRPHSFWEWHGVFFQ